MRLWVWRNAERPPESAIRFGYASEAGPTSESAVDERAGGAVAAGALPAPRGAPPNGSIGRTRAGLEVWLARQDVELPEMLVEAARSLADEVDREPKASPLWGRYLDAARQLHERRCRSRRGALR
jgi:hypothetical protein